MRYIEYFHGQVSISFNCTWINKRVGFLPCSIELGNMHDGRNQI